MSHLCSVDFLFDAMPGKSVDSKSHGRGVWPYAPTKGINKRRYGFINIGISRNMFVMLFVLSWGSALAHEGFNVVLKDATVNPYIVTVLEDTHLINNQPQTNLMIQVAHGREAAPADTKVFLKLEQDRKLIYNSEVEYVASSSSDGSTFYAYYILTIPLPQQGIHQARLELDGSLGNATTTFQFEAKAIPDFRAVELIPSLLIISICFAGSALFFFSSRMPQHNTLTQQDSKGFHHA
jgi:hypothetical protein